MNIISADLYFADLFENTSDLIHYVTLQGEIEKVNPAWLSNLGYSLEEVIGKPIYGFVADDEVSTFKAYRDACIKTNVYEEIQVTFKAKNGDPVIMEGHLRPFFIAGNLRHTRGVFRNVTLKKERERLQYQEFSKLAQFLTNAPDAVVIINEDQRVVEWNLKAAAIFGYQRESVLNHSLSDLIIPVEFREAHHTGMLHFLKTGHGPVLNKTIEVPAIDHKLREFPISLSISAVKILNEWFFIAFISDISEKKKKEQILIQKELELERSLLDDHRNKEFLTIASHELKTPLTSLKAYLQLALKGFDNQPKERIINFLIKAEDISNKLGKLILDLLDISKIHAGKLALDIRPVEINTVISEIVQTSQLLYPSHQLNFSFTGTVTVNVDKDRIEQVIVNLINNAVKYSPNADRVDITVHTKNRHVYISVKDYGTGIDVINQHKVFDKFYRIEELPKKDNQGLGIGLFISSEIIKQHAGTIWIENNENGGATFFVTLPL